MNTPIVNTSLEMLDFDFIHESISNTYWAKGRSKEMMQTCIRNSLNFGLYYEGKQIGYARVVSDYAQFAYLMDVYIDPNFRGNGYANILLKAIFDNPNLKDVLTWRLATTDAKGLYEKFGFTQLSKPDNMMERLK